MGRLGSGGVVTSSTGLAWRVVVGWWGPMWYLFTGPRMPGGAPGCNKRRCRKYECRVVVVTFWAGCFTSPRLEKTSVWLVLLVSGGRADVSLQLLLRILERKQRGKENASVSFLLAAETRDQQQLRSALSLWLPWKHISVCCRRRCHRNCFHFILMTCYVQESINKIQVGGMWLCLRTGNSSFSCSQITLTLRSFLIELLMLSHMCLLILWWLM